MKAIPMNLQVNNSTMTSTEKITGLDHAVSAVSLFPLTDNYWLYIAVIAIVILSVCKSSSLAQKLGVKMMRKRAANLINQANRIVDFTLEEGADEKSTAE